MSTSGAHRSIIEFRFPGGRWEAVPPGYTIETAKILYANYELRVDGKKIEPTEQAV